MKNTLFEQLVCITQIWAEPEKSVLPICNCSQILYRFLAFALNLKEPQTLYPKIQRKDKCELFGHTFLVHNKVGGYAQKST